LLIRSNVFRLSYEYNIRRSLACSLYKGLFFAQHCTKEASLVKNCFAKIGRLFCSYLYVAHAIQGSIRDDVYFGRMGQIPRKRSKLKTKTIDQRLDYNIIKRASVGKCLLINCAIVVDDVH
jgi:hypothetical protein